MPLRSVITGSGFLQNLRGTPLEICDTGIYFMQNPLGGHPLRFVILGSILSLRLQCEQIWLTLGSVGPKNKMNPLRAQVGHRDNIQTGGFH